MKYETFFELAKENNFTNTQITEKKSISSSFELINGVIDSYDDSNTTSYTIKAEKNDKTVKINCDYLDETILDDLNISIENTDSAYKEEYLEKTNNIPFNKEPNFTINQELKKLKELDSIRKKYPQVKDLNLYFSETYTNTRIINDKSVDISTDSRLSTFIVEAVVEENGKTTTYDQKILETDKTKINFSELIENTITKAILLINKEKIKSDKYNIILDSKVAGNIIGHLSSMLSATKIRNNISCLSDKINTKTFSKKLSIVEDPTNDLYPGYRLFDDEGTKTTKKMLVEKGIIKTELYNNKEAKLKNIKSTGNSYGSIGTKNMYVLPGTISKEELLKKLDNGIYITDYMGASGTSINSITGNMSLQIFGFQIKNGEIASGIEPCIMTTTIFELLSNVESIASNLQFETTSSASPDLLINNISIAS